VLEVEEGWIWATMTALEFPLAMSLAAACNAASEAETWLLIVLLFHTIAVSLGNGP
jgi:hypothetical protein